MVRLAIPGAVITETMRAARLRRWVIVFGIVAIAANAAAAAYDTWRSRQITVEDTKRELANVARTLGAQTAGSLRTIDVLLRDTVEWYARDGAAATPGAINAVLASRAEGLPQLLRLSIADAQGILRYRSDAPAPQDPAISDRSYFTAHRDNPALGLFISEPITTRSEQRRAIALSRGLTDSSGRFAGVVAGYLDLDRLQEFYRAIHLGAQSTILLLRDNGDSVTPLLREPPALRLTDEPAPPGTAWLRDIETATELVTPVDGVERFAAGARVEGLPLVVAVMRDKRAVLDPWRDETLRVATRTLILSLLGAAAIAALVRQLRRVETGERALRASEERYALAMQGANEGHFDWHMQGGPSFVSAKMKELLGLPAGESIATRQDAFASAEIHPQDKARIETALQKHLQGLTDRYEVEFRARQADGEWHWLQVRGRCLRDAQGTALRLAGSVSDVSERKRAEAEQQRLEVELRKSQKMEAMGTLAGGIAHDFNNILGAILGYGEMAQKNAPQDSVVRRYVDNVMSAGKRAKALVERILAFGRSGLGERVPVNVQAVAEETLELLKASLPAGVHMTHRLEAGDAAVIGDATQLHEVVMNLCTNALQAMPQGGVLDVLLDRTDVPEARTLSHGSLVPGPYVRLQVRDTGSGIAPAVLERMFDPFFTTKGVGEGTGLGLSLVYGLVADCGGAIDVATREGAGSTFSVWLPAQGETAPPLADSSADLPRGDGETVMVVDDERPLVALAEETLALLGYEPAGFASSLEALAAFRAEPGRYDLVLTDETMPELTGTELAREIRRLRADVPIVLMSGYSGPALTERALAAGAQEVLRKPLVSVDIAKALARALARRA